MSTLYEQVRAAVIDGGDSGEWAAKYDLVPEDRRGFDEWLDTAESYASEKLESLGCVVDGVVVPEYRALRQRLLEELISAVGEA